MIEAMCLTDRFCPYCSSPHRSRKADIEGTLRISSTTDELGYSFVSDPEILATDRTGTDCEFLVCLVHDLPADDLTVRFKRIKDLMKHCP